MNKNERNRSKKWNKHYRSGAIILPIKGCVTKILSPCEINIRPALITGKPFVFWKKSGSKIIGPLEAIPVKKIPILDEVKFLDLKNLIESTVLLLRMR